MKLDSSERFVRKDDTPTEGVVSLVLLEDIYLDVGQALFQQDGKVKRGRATTDADDLHGSPMLGRALATLQEHESADRDRFSTCRPDGIVLASAATISP